MRNEDWPHGDYGHVSCGMFAGPGRFTLTTFPKRKQRPANPEPVGGLFLCRPSTPEPETSMKMAVSPAKVL